MHEEKFVTGFNEFDFPSYIVYAVPIMLLFVAIEYWVGHNGKKNLYCNKDLLASCWIGVGNLVVNGSLKAFLLMLFVYFYAISPFRVPHVWWVYPLSYICFDFISYWAHRISHKNRFFWATHVPHHSSAKYNLSVSFRLSWIQNIKVFFFLPLAFIGFHPIPVFVSSQFGVLYQFWLHTRLIGKLPAFIEYIFVTPSHHRVHHATNGKYLDKNFASTFIIWDRMFGTFEEETEEPVYGITKPVNSFNPFYLNFHELINIYRDFKNTKSWPQRIKLLKEKP